MPGHGFFDILLLLLGEIVALFADLERKVSICGTNYVKMYLRVLLLLLISLVERPFILFFVSKLSLPLPGSKSGVIINLRNYLKDV